MTQRPPPPSSASPRALFRYFVLGQVEALTRSSRPVGDAVREVAEREHIRPDGRLVRVSVRTIQRWRRAFAKGGMEALEPARRVRVEVSLVLPAALVDFLRSEKEADPAASVPEVLRRAREQGIVPPDLEVDRTTLWRACRRMSLPTRERPHKREADTRRFAYPNRMQCVLADGKHFRAGAAELKRVALFYLDDSTRFLLDVVVDTAESTEFFLRGLHRLVSRHGLMDLVYLDRGPGFISDDTLAVIQALDAWLVHGQTRYPQGHGKIERFNRTAFAQCLRALVGAAIDPDCAALELRLRHFIERYNDTPHEALGGDTPRMRWETDTRPLRFPEDLAELERRFLVREARSVSADHVIRHGGRLWEAPRGLARKRIEVHRNALSGALFVLHRGAMVRLHELDAAANATERRGYPKDDHPLPSEGVPTTAAEAAFRRDFGPIVGPDGGFEEN